MGNKASNMIILAVSLVFLGTLTGCRENPEKKIIGEWRDLDQDYFIHEFTINGEWILWLENRRTLDREVECRLHYEFVETNTIDVSKFEGHFKTVFSEDELTLTQFDPDNPDVKGEIFRMKKIK